MLEDHLIFIRVSKRVFQIYVRSNLSINYERIHMKFPQVNFKLSSYRTGRWDVDPYDY